MHTCEKDTPSRQTFQNTSVRMPTTGVPVTAASATRGSDNGGERGDPGREEEEVPSAIPLYNSAAEGVPVGEVVAASEQVERRRDIRCRDGHRMVYQRHDTNHDRGREFFNCCRREIKPGTYYYACTTCTERYGYTTGVKANRHLFKLAQWSTGVFDCHMDGNSCVEGFVCMHCFQARMCCASKEELPVAEDACFFLGDCRVGLLLCAGDLFIPLFFNFYSIDVRREMVKSYGIDESCCESMVIGYFCRCCSDCQVHREMTIQGHYPGNVCCSGPNKKFLASLPPRIKRRMQ